MNTKIYHLVDRREIADQRTGDRIWKAQQSWEPLYENSELIPLHCWSYPRNAKDVLGDARPLPFVRDLFSWGMQQCQSDDIIFWCNDDNYVLPDLPERLRFHCSVYQGPCSIFRTEIRGSMPSLKLRPEDFAKRSTEKHVGRDGFAFKKSWLESNFDALSDWVLGAACWDIHFACMVRLAYGIKTTNANIWQNILPAEIPNGHTAHQSHVSSWLADSVSNRHNSALFKAWAEQHLPELRLTKEGNLA